MKKIYLLGLFTAVASVSFAQWSVQQSPARRTFTRSEISPRASIRQEMAPSIDWSNRVVLLSEDFQSVTGAMPGALPTGWSTLQVTQADASLGNAFKTHNSTTANGGGYWPVPQVGTGNKFAGVNDDNTPCDCDNIDSYVQSPSMDFSAASNIAISFDIFHDMNFGGGDATLQISTDGGATFNIRSIGIDAAGASIDVFPADQDYWQSIIVPLYDITASNVIIRFQWTDGGSWASGFAVDNVVVGELPASDIRVVKTKVGDWNQANFGLGFWDYNRVPVTQVSPVHATSVIFNGGTNDQVDATMNYAVTFNGTPVAGSPFAADQTSAAFLSLDKDTISVSTTWTPSAVGTIQITGTTTSTTGDDVASNNTGSATMQITDFTYGRDADAAQAFMGPTSDFEVGNLFDIYADDQFGGIDVAIGAGSAAGDPIIGRIYLFEGFDAAGAPIFTDLALETTEYIFTGNEFNSVGGNAFVTLPFASAITLNAGNVYLVVVSCVTGTRIPVSGSNEWVVSWLYDGTAWGATGSVPMVRLNSDETAAVAAVNGTTSFELAQNMPNPSNGNTTIVYNLPSNERVTLTVRDMTGRVVAVSNEGVKPAGKNMISLNTSAFGAGVYTYTITAGSSSLTKEMMVK
ncbi:MAG: T9SS type A sorting domain-containing protein [Sediminibacterium sp.]